MGLLVQVSGAGSMTQVLALIIFQYRLHVPHPPSHQQQQATNPICSNATTTLTANGVAGTNATVTWWTGTGGTGTPVGTGNVSNPVGPGTYYAYVTGDCLPAAEASVTVTGQAPPNAGIDGNLTICAGSTVTAPQLFAALTGGPDAGGSWSPALAGAGVYTYTVNAIAPCTGTDVSTVTVTEQAQPNAGIDGNLTICAGSTVTAPQLFGALTGGPDAGGSWSPALAGAGVYTYTVNAIAPCTGTDVSTVTVTEQAQPNAGIDGNLTICAGSTVTAPQLFAALTGGPDAGGSWSPALAGAGVYTYTVNAIAPCTGTDVSTVTVTEQAQPNAGIDGNLTICAGSTVTAPQLFAALTGGPDAGGSWSPALAGAGVYTYTVNAIAPCTGTDVSTVTVTEQAQPNAGTNGALTICSSTTLTTGLLSGALGGSPDPGGSWSPVPAGAGVYTYTVNATAPCTVPASATVTVTVQAAPTATIAYSAATYTTADPVQSVTITGTPNTGTFSAPAGLSINAANGDITPSTSTAPGTYLVTYTVPASGVCPVYTATTTVTINPFVVSVLNCSTPLDFSSPVSLSPTQAPGVWYTDRYAPFGFAISGDLGGSTLKHSINAADGEVSRPPAYVSTFYNTQGRKYDLEAGTTTLKIKLYVPLSWATSGKRMAGLWGTAFDNTNAVSALPDH
ncbi:MAG: hypothetical protein V9F01_07910 [Chitinophagaceae bacterium]